MTKNYETLINQAIEELKTNGELFVDMVNELDSWNGYADGFRCFPMYEIDDLFCGCKISEFLDKLTVDFDHNADYIVDTIYGLDSTNDIEDVYRDNVDEGDLLDNIIDYANHIYFNDSDFEDLINEIIDAREADDEEEGNDTIAA